MKGKKKNWRKRIDEEFNGNHDGALDDGLTVGNVVNWQQPFVYEVHRFNWCEIGTVRADWNHERSRDGRAVRSLFRRSFSIIFTRLSSPSMKTFSHEILSILPANNNLPLWPARCFGSLQLYNVTALSRNFVLDMEGKREEKMSTTWTVIEKWVDPMTPSMSFISSDTKYKRYVNLRLRVVPSLS